MSASTRSGRGVGSFFGHRAAGGTTLIEVLITLVVMAIVMAGVLSALKVVTTAVGDSRAVMEMSDRLRSTQQRLRADLAGMTAPATPWLRPEAGLGYLEIIEGPIRDTDYTPEVNGNTAVLTNLRDRPRDHTKGDADDIIMFTTRSQGEPFVGRFGNTTVESQVAEVVWFASWDPETDNEPATGNPLAKPNDTTPTPARPILTGTGNPNIVANNLFPDVTTKRDWPLLKLYRRVFLVMPELGVIGEQEIVTSGAQNLNDVENPPPPAAPVKRGLMPSQHDISVRRVVKSTASGVTTIQWVANSLGDLTIPRNRTGHAGNLVPPVTAVGTGATDPAPTPNTPAAAVPVVFPLALNRLVPLPNPLPLTSGLPDPTSRYGQDVVLTNVLGFDIKVWDPQAPVYLVTGPVATSGTDEARDRTPKLLKAGAAVAPGDPGYERMLEMAVSATGRPPDARGAYVDLYYSYFPNNNAPTATNLSIASSGATNRAKFMSDINSGPTPQFSIFAGPGFLVNRATQTPDTFLPPLPAGVTIPSFATYDTWSMHYEFAGARPNVAPTDNSDGRGTNGQDDAVGTTAANGVVDDIIERVTSPPYPAPLRGIQIKLRVYEPDSKQVREVTVVESLVPE